MNLPRVLVINPIPFCQETGSGVTTGNLFRHWPKDQIAQIYSFESEAIQKDYSICENYLHVLSEGLSESASKIWPQVIEFLGRKRLALGKWIINFPDILAWAKEFSPDIIYARPLDYPPFYCWLPRQLSQTLDIPYVTHMMDDWPAQFEYRKGFANTLIRNPILQRNLNKLFANSTVNIGISDEMCHAYQKRYGCHFIKFHNCIDFGFWQIEDQSYENKSEFEFVYMGSVTERKELQSLIDVKCAILALKKAGFSVSFSLYGPDLYKDIILRELQVSPVINYKGFVDVMQKPTVLAKADALILPINFDFQSFPYMQYSFQTKLPEYMASGRPILLYGPPTNPNIRYAQTEQCGLIVDRPDQTLLQTAMLRLIQSQKLRKKLGKKSRILALGQYDCQTIRAHFQTLLKEASGKA